VRIGTLQLGKEHSVAGQIVHFEIPAADVERAKRFWSGVFGWQFGDSAMPGFEYYLVEGGAVYPSEDLVGKGPIVYYGTDDIEDSIAKVREHGGEAGDRQPIPHVGWFSRCRDSEGNSFSLFQSDESVTD
jgi:predicted enzyme related to lactoylglutathione lyase